MYAMTMAEKAWFTMLSASVFPKEAEMQAIEYIASMNGPVKMVVSNVI
jgi:hypothetical protein